MKNRSRIIGLIAPFPPPLGGMAIQATKLVENLEREGYEIVSIPTNMPLPKKICFLERVMFLRTLVRSLYLLHKINIYCRRVDVFYFLTGFFHYFFWVTLPVLLLLKAKNKRVILSARGGDAGRFFAKWKPLVRRILSIPRIITVPSGFLQKDFSDHLNIETVIVPNIADLKQFHFKKRPVIRPRFIVTRHLEPIYNIECVIRAFKIISDEIPGSFLTIAGDGSQKEQLQKLVDSLNLNGSVSFLGRVPHDQLPDLYNSHDIFINASNVDNVPGAILEAFASGLPVITTGAGGIPFIVDHEKTGFVVNPNDCKSLARYAISVMSSTELSNTIINKAFVYVHNYTWDKIRLVLLPILNS